MLHRIKILIEKLAPNAWLDVYHKILAKMSSFWYGHPSRELVVIGVTGTNGKTTTAYLLAKALGADGSKTGCTSTALFKIADKEWLNATKMTMLGRFALQKFLRQIVDAGCKYVVIETSSQGIIQHRHEQVAYDIGVFTNLTPEHIEAHGGFENYKQAKIKLFEHIAGLPPKKINGQVVPRAFVLNVDDQYAKDFALKGSQAIWYGLGQGADLKAENIHESADGVSFVIPASSVILNVGEESAEPTNISKESDGSLSSALGLHRDDKVEVNLKLLSRVNVYNALATLAVCRVLGVDLKAAAQKLGEIKNMPGRFERIEQGQPWMVMVDYAPEPESLKRLYEEVKLLNAKRIIHVLGSCGGGRDVARRPVLGKLAAQNAAYVIVTNEDPYDDDPMEIIHQVAEGARQGGKKEGEDLFLILERGQAIQKAMDLAEPGDLVLLTGKGSEQRMCVAGGKKIPWDDREAAKDAIKQTIAERAQRA
ncbi:MAG: UDP-N-acetylmuramoyl-L-alanyl-D-glutamate--2,6-diaminopimelate ligase [Patescibacteria group bacterium]|jgi:UDP-N-acetylmuramoyl-L-alanyl-D-glutamate--2,6-diaminopimelate ligase